MNGNFVIDKTLLCLATVDLKWIVLWLVATLSTQSPIGFSNSITLLWLVGWNALLSILPLAWTLQNLFCDWLELSSNHCPIGLRNSKTRSVIGCNAHPTILLLYWRESCKNSSCDWLELSSNHSPIGLSNSLTRSVIGWNALLAILPLAWAIQ